MAVRATMSRNTRKGLGDEMISPDELSDWKRKRDLELGTSICWED
jgi:hypothetical protein